MTGFVGLLNYCISFVKSFENLRLTGGVLGNTVEAFKVKWGTDVVYEEFFYGNPDFFIGFLRL